jgi:hypothetical protein
MSSVWAWDRISNEERLRMRMREKVFLSMLVIGVLGSLTAVGVFGAFTATTSNSGNEFQTGSLTIGDNDSGSAMYFVSNARPGDSVTKCIKVTYTGTLQGDINLYATNTVGPLAQYVDLTITPGTQTSSTFPDCTGFTPQAGGALYNGTLQNFAATYTNFASNLHSNPAGKTAWDANDSVVYRFQVTLNESAPSSAEAQSTGDHGFAWEVHSN